MISRIFVIDNDPKKKSGPNVFCARFSEDLDEISVASMRMCKLVASARPIARKMPAQILKTVAVSVFVSSFLSTLNKLEKLKDISGALRRIHCECSFRKWTARVSEHAKAEVLWSYKLSNMRSEPFIFSSAFTHCYHWIIVGKPTCLAVSSDTVVNRIATSNFMEKYSASGNNVVLGLIDKSETQVMKMFKL